MSIIFRLIIIIIIAIFIILFSLSKGSTAFSLYQLFSIDKNQFALIFYKIRLPRTLAAFTTGGLLSLAGILIQLLLQNPLADPYILGISSSAAFFALLFSIWPINGFGLIASAWLGSLIAIVLMTVLNHRHSFKSSSVILSGLALAYAFSAGISLLLLLMPSSALHGLLFWLNGDLNEVFFSNTGWIILIIGALISFALAPGLNLLSRGEKEAQSLGLPLKKYRFILYLLSSLFTATAISLAGCIGFIGLIIPHLTRKIVGNHFQILIPTSILLGGSFLTLTDTLARTLFAPQQIPVGIFMALLGVPVFIWLSYQH